MSEMARQETAEMIMIVLLLLCGFLFVLRAVLKANQNKNAAPVIGAVVFVLYGMISFSLVYIFRAMGNTENMLFMLMLVIACLILGFVIFYIYRHFRDFRKGTFALFAVYLAALLYITIISRIGSSNHDTSIRMVAFSFLTEANGKLTASVLNHMMLNVVLFVPLGFLFPLVYEEGLNRWSYVVPVGLMLTTLIETIQLLCGMGQCDIDDIIANTLGMALGMGVYRLFRRFTGYQGGFE